MKIFSFLNLLSAISSIIAIAVDHSIHIRMHERWPCLCKWVQEVSGDIGGAIALQGQTMSPFSNFSSHHPPHTGHKKRRIHNEKTAYHIYLDGINQKFSANLYHFSRSYFRFFSLLLWGVSANPVDQRTIRGGVQIPAEAFDKSLNVNWIADMVSAVDKFFHIRSYHREKGSSDDPTDPTAAAKQRFNIDLNEHYSFLPSKGLDVYILGSIILKRPICPLLVQANYDESTLRVRLLNRHGTRTISNDHEVVHFISAMLNSTRKLRKPILYFDEKILNPQFATAGIGTGADAMFTYKDTPLVTQVAAMVDTDLLVAAHGAGLTNLVFMRPCSILIEIFPYHYAPQCYADFAAGVSVLYYKINTPLNGTILNPDKGCKGVLPLVNDPVQAAELSCQWGESAMEKKCRKCARGNPSMSVDMLSLGHILREALLQRKQCLATHPAYK